VFSKVISTTEKVDEFEVRVQILLHEITLAVYTNVSRGLFERHKLVFSFLLCASIYKQAGIINEMQWNFLLRGPVSAGMVSHPEVHLLLLSQLSQFIFLSQRFHICDNAIDELSLYTWQNVPLLQTVMGSQKEILKCKPK
jgi:dynein heavy chain